MNNMGRIDVPDDSRIYHSVMILGYYPICTYDKYYTEIPPKYILLFIPLTADNVLV
jgi:hypothetical protein